MKINILPIIATCLFLLVGCNSIKTLSNQSQIRDVVGKDVVTIRPVLLWRLTEPLHFDPSIPYFLYEKDSGNSWRKDGWLPIGTTIKILEVNRYVTNEAGPWVGVVGTADLPKEGRVKFVYKWPSSKYSLNRAAWENDQTPESRPLNELR